MKLAQRKAVGYVMACFALFIIVFGTIGYTIEGQVEDVPTPNIEGYVFFSDEALPQNPVGLFVSADTSITWDRDDIFLVIANESKKDQCDGIRANGGAFLQSGEYYAGIGTKLGTLPAGTELNIDYEVKLSASFPTYLFSLLLGIGGLALTRME